MRGHVNLLISLGVLIAAICFLPVHAQAAEVNLDSPDVEVTDTTKGNVGAATRAYTAQPGDSLTILARRTVADYLVSLQKNLNPAQKVYAETVLVQANNPRRLAVGERVEFNLSQVESIIVQAGQLSPARQAAWAPWAELAGL